MKPLPKLALFALLPCVGILPVPAAITDNLFVYYNFEDAATNGTIPNNAGTGPAATIVGATTTSGFAGDAAWNSIGASGAGNTTNRSTLIVGKAANFSRTTAGSTDRVNVGVSRTNLMGATPVAGAGFTLSAWYFAAIDPNHSAATAQRYFVFEDGTNTTQFDLSWGSQNALPTVTDLNMFAYNNGFTSTTVQGNVSVSAWHHIVHAFTYDGTNTVLSVYRDGVLQNTTPYSIAGFPDFTEINVGNARDNNGRAWDGMIDEVAIWSRPLSQSEVTDAYTRGIQHESLTLVKYSVALTATPTIGGTVTGSGTYNAGVQVPVAATTSLGYLFSGWSGGFTGQPASFTYTANASVTSTATFAQDTADSDGDGLSNYQELVVTHTLPNNPDTDGDQIPDGAEVNTTGTSPTISDTALVSFVGQNLSPNAAGAIAFSPITLERNPTSGQIQLSFNFLGSPNQTTWSTIPLSDPSVSITPSDTGWDLVLPAPSNTVNSYILKGRKP